MPIADYERLIGASSYPGLPSVEVEIARKWLRANRDKYDRVEFNIRLGTGESVPGHLPAFVATMHAANTQKRADIVAWNGLNPTIVELKPRVGFSALGQLLGYWWLWKKTYPEQREPALLAVGDSAISEVDEVFNEFGVKLELVS